MVQTQSQYYQKVFLFLHNMFRTSLQSIFTIAEMWLYVHTNNTSDLKSCQRRTRVHGQWFIFIYTSFLAVSLICQKGKYRHTLSHSFPPYFVYRSLDRLIVNIMNLTGCLKKKRLTKAFSILGCVTQIELLGHNYHSKIYRSKHITRDSRMSRRGCSNLKSIVTYGGDSGGRAV
jgi:hypothetical protein